MILLHTINRLRTDYHAWLAYIEDKPDHYTRYANDEERVVRKEQWFEKLCVMFPEAKLKEGRDQLLAQVEERRALNAKFNGNIVSEVTGLQGKDLGNFLSAFKKSFDSPEELE